MEYRGRRRQGNCVGSNSNCGAAVLVIEFFEVRKFERGYVFICLTKKSEKRSLTLLYVGKKAGLSQNDT